MSRAVGWDAGVNGGGKDGLGAIVMVLAGWRKDLGERCLEFGDWTWAVGLEKEAAVGSRALFPARERRLLSVGLYFRELMCGWASGWRQGFGGTAPQERWPRRTPRAPTRLPRSARNDRLLSVRSTPNTYGQRAR